MKIIFLPSSKADLRWFKRYYISVFPEGRRNADQQYQALLRILKATPMVGHPAHGFANAREFPIQRTPFTVIYRVEADRNDILRVLDQRSAYSNERRK